LLPVSACSRAGSEPAAAGPATSPPSRAASVAPASPATAEEVAACKLAAKAPRAGEAIDLDEKAIKDIIADAGKSGRESIKQAGTQVQARYSAWLHAEIGDEAAKALDDLLDAVGRLHRACIAAPTS
jgi:hypothetical protein